jgi:hypothetical protein
VAVNANVNSGTGAIAISANTAGSGSAGYTQATAATLTTTNTTASALTITVNTSSGGTGSATVGDASVGVISSGASTGGTYTVNAHGGPILWNNTAASRGTSSVPANIITAYGFAFSDSGAGGVGTSATPLQLDDDTNGGNPFSASAGSGGIYVNAFDSASSTNGLLVDQAVATGGNIDLETGTGIGHVLFINGTVSTTTGAIRLYAEDEMYLDDVNAGPAYTLNAPLANALVGGPGFSGTVDVQANTDLVNGQFVDMAPGSAIVTSNGSTSTSAPAVSLKAYPASGPIGSGIKDIPAGGIELSNITVGAGGTIVVDAAAGTASARQGSIVQHPGTLLDTGGTGKVVLTARQSDTASTSGALVGGNIGVGGTATAPTLLPILTNAATITATTNGTSLGNTGSIAIINAGAATFTATTTGNATGTISLTCNSGVLTIGGATSTAGGAITLNGTGSNGGVTLKATLGSSTTGAIAINGPLSGSSNIVMGTGGLTVTQAANSTYGGVISGASGDSVALAGGGALTLTSTYTGPTTVSGTLLVDGKLASAVTAAAGATLGGAGGSVSPPVTIDGTLSPGDLASLTGLLTVGQLALAPAAAFNVALNGTMAGSGYDQVTVSGGTVNVNGAALNLTVGAGFSPPVGTAFDILVNNTGAPIQGLFAGLPEGATLFGGSQLFQITYQGGASGHDVVLTKVALSAIAVSGVAANGGAAAATVAAATESGTTATLTTAAPGGFYPGELVTVAGVSVAGYDGTYSVGSVISPTTFTYTAGAAGLAAGTGGTATSALAGPQRSMVDSLAYTFDHPVTVGSGGFTIALHPGVAVNGGTPGTVGTVPTLSWSSPDGGLTWVVTFGGSSVVNNSIADGVYDITLDAADVTDAAGQALAMNRVDTFYRLYGDTQGHLTVNNSDTFQAKKTFLLSAGQAGYLAYLDYNGDGTVNNTDTFQLKKRFLTNYGGFTPTL